MWNTCYPPPMTVHPFHSTRYIPMEISSVTSQQLLSTSVAPYPVHSTQSNPLRSPSPVTSHVLHLYDTPPISCHPLYFHAIPSVTSHPLHIITHCILTGALHAFQTAKITITRYISRVTCVCSRPITPYRLHVTRYTSPIIFPCCIICYISSPVAL